jgi:hypothetical protein
MIVGEISTNGIIAYWTFSEGKTDSCPREANAGWSGSTSADA